MDDQNDIIDLVDLISDDGDDDDPIQQITPNTHPQSTPRTNSTIITIDSTPELSARTDRRTTQPQVPQHTQHRANRICLTSIFSDDEDDVLVVNGPSAQIQHDSSHLTSTTAQKTIPNPQTTIMPISDDDDDEIDREIDSLNKKRPTPAHLLEITPVVTSVLAPNLQQPKRPRAPKVSPSKAAMPTATPPIPPAPAAEPVEQNSLASILPAMVLSDEVESDAESDNDDADEDFQPPDGGITPNPAAAANPGEGISEKFASELVQLSNKCSDATQEEPTPCELNVALLRHQRQALCWMSERERVEHKPVGHPRGGILADDQGFGKTLSLIGLMIKNRPPPRQGSDKPTAWGNLIVAPTSILHQWASELEDRIDSPYRPSVYIYHGPKRTKDPYKLVCYDVVITSYGMLSQEYPKETKVYDPVTRKRVDVITRAKGPLYKIGWHRVILDEAQAIKNRNSEAHRAAVTLRAKCRWVVTGTPIQNSIDDIYSQFLFLRYQVVDSYSAWKTRFKKPLEGTCSAMRRERVFKQFQALLAVVLLRRAKHDTIGGKPVMPLPKRTVRTMELNFSRTELAYYQAQEFSAVKRMNSIVGDAEVGNKMMNALVVLLRLRQACNHPKLCEWNSTTEFKFSDHELDAVGLRMQTRSLFSKLEDAVKSRLFVELGPESTTVQTCPVCMDVVELEGVVTKCGHLFCKTDFDAWSRENDSCPSCRMSVGNDNQSMSLATVRKEVHVLVRNKKREEEGCVEVESKRENSIALLMSGQQTTGTPSPEGEEEEAEEGEEQPRKRRRGANGSAIRSQKEGADSDDVKTEAKEENISPKAKSIATSTKIIAFLKEFKDIHDNTNDKVLCFSQFTRMLDLVEEQLQQKGYELVRLDGSQSLEQRAEMVRLFNTRSKCRLFLISLKAGSTGLNLTVANRVFLLDSWWNPAVENQAIDRVHRIGQQKDVEVVKLKITGTVEEQILALQEKKRQIAEGALGTEGLKMLGRKRLTMEDVLGLFRDVYENVAQRAEEQQDSATANMAQSLVDSVRNWTEQ